MLELLSLPDIVLEKILSYMNYDDIARYRIVSVYRLTHILDCYSIICILCENNRFGVVTESAFTVQ
jgi:hypothetical protein